MTCRFGSGSGRMSFQEEQQGVLPFLTIQHPWLGAKKNNLPDHYNCYNCYLKQTQDYLSNSCDAMPKCVVMIIIVSGQMLRVLTGLL